MNTLAIDIQLQNATRVLTIFDITLVVADTFGWDAAASPYPWTVDQFFDINDANYADRLINIVVTIETKEKTYTCEVDKTDMLNMISAGNVQIASQADIYYNFGINSTTDTLELITDISSIANYDTLPDGIYSITYQIDLDGDINDGYDYSLESEYVLTYAADAVLMGKTDDIQDKMFTCPNFAIEDALDYLVYRTLHASLNNARLVASRETILNTLDHINNETYEYFKN